MRRYVLLVGAPGMVALGLWMAGRTSEEDPLTARHEPVSAVEVETEAEDGAIGSAATADGPRAPTVRSVERESAAAVTGVVRDADGKPVAGAEVSWTPVREDLRKEELHREMDWSWMRTATQSTRTDGEGSFSLREPRSGEGELGGVLWATHLGHRAGFALTPPRQGSQGSFHVIEVALQAPADVIVRRSGEPAAGATVRHTLDFWSEDLGEEEKLARRFFLREHSAEDGGRLQLSLTGGGNRLQAFHGDLRSRAWTGRPDEPHGDQGIELELLETFVLSGQVFADQPDFSFEGVRYNVGYYSAEDFSDFEWAPGARGVADVQGRFGPHAWVRPTHESLHVRVSGGGLIPVGDYFRLPEAGGTLHVDLQTQVGLEIEVEVVDREEAALEGAGVVAHRFDESGDLSHGGEARTDDSGRATVRGLRAGDYELTVSLRGFQSVAVTDERTVLPPLDESPIRIELVQAGVLRGITVYDREPVTAFTVNAWNGDQSYWRAIEVNDEEGRFLFDDVPAEETVFVTAYAEGLPQSEVVPVPPGAERDVELVLPEPIATVGRALDAFTLEPVPTATVQALVSGQTAFLTWRDSPVPVEADGTFVLEGTVPGRGGISLVAPGYEPIYMNLGSEARDVIDVGDVPLSPERRLQVQVIDDRATDYTAYRAWNEHVKSEGPVPLGADGTCELPSYSLYYVHVRTPDKSLLTEQAAVGPGDEPFVLFDLTHGTDVFVSLRSVPDGVDGYSVKAHSPEGIAARSRAAIWNAESRGFLVRGLPEGDATLELFDASRTVVCRKPLRIEAVDLQRVELTPGGSTWRIRLLNRAGEPYPSMPVDAFAAGGGSWSQRSNTDHDGVFEVGPLDAERLILCGKPASEFCAWGVEVDLPPEPDEVIEVVLKSAGRCYLKLIEEGRPARGVRIEFTHPRSPYHRPFIYFSDEEGLVDGPEFLSGEYTASVVSARRWRSAHVVHAGRESEPISIEVYSLGRVVCEARDAQGAPVAGARFDLEHADLGESVADWLARGQVDASAQTCTTDASGHLLLDRMPRGRYAWRCQMPSGAVLAGTTQLPPRGTVTVVARAQDR